MSFPHVEELSAPELIARIYDEMGLAVPNVISYPSLDDAIGEFSTWKNAASASVAAAHWASQYPILHPRSHWATNHLFDDGFQFDIARTPKEDDCCLHRQFLSKIEIEPKFLHNRYVTAALEAFGATKTSEFDRLKDQLRRESPDFVDGLQQFLDAELPTNQMPVLDFALLAPFEWLQIERKLLLAMRAFVGRPVCERHFENVRLLVESGAVFLTFGRLVVATRAPKNC